MKLFLTSNYYAARYLVLSPKVRRRKSRNGRGQHKVLKYLQKRAKTETDGGTIAKGSCWKIYIHSFVANLDYWKKRGCKVNSRESISSSSIRPLETVATVWYLFSQLKAWTTEEPLRGKTSLLLFTQKTLRRIIIIYC